MSYQKHQEELEQVKNEMINNFSNIVRYHGVREEIIYYLMYFLSTTYQSIKPPSK